MKVLTITADAKEKLSAYPYPGNVRELKAMIDLAAVMSDGIQVTADDITFASARSSDMLLSQERTLREYTVEIIRAFLKKYDNNVVRVAQKLDVGKSTIYKMIQDKEINI
jgi:DNA-binding NtrC family response regulator